MHVSARGAVKGVFRFLAPVNVFFKVHMME